MNRRAYSFMAGLIGAGIAGWFWSRNNKSRNGGTRHIPDRGTVIFDNTPRPSGNDVPL